MRAIIFTILCFVITENGYSQHFRIRGKVNNEVQLTIENAHVLIKGTSIGVYTDKQGAYKIKVKEGDVLSFSYLGMQTLEIRIEEGMEVLDVELSPQNESLDSVLIKEKSNNSQKIQLREYPTNKNLIKTAQGIIDKDRASFAIRIIDGDQLITFGSDFLYSLQNMYPAMIVDRTDGNVHQPKVYLQSWSYNARPTAIFDVDGIIHEQAPTFLSANDIDRVAILVRNGAVARYGPAGAGGVIIINTKTFIPEINVKEEPGNYDNSALRDSIYQVVSEPVIYQPQLPYYLKELAIAKSKSQARKLFEKYKKYKKYSPYYFIDASDFFYNTWNDKQKALEILMLVKRQFSDDISVLRALAFKYENMDEPDLAFDVYLKIFNLMPRHAQSHRDISNAYVKLGNYKSALNRYLNYESTIKKLDTIDYSNPEVGSVMKSESANIIKQRGKRLEISDKIIDDVFESPSTRLLFEWNNNQAEFEIRIVDAENSYYSWNRLRAHDNVLKQFFLDKSFRETKRLQIIYHGNKTKNPTYLKVTLFFNYGKHNQNSESRIYRLKDEHVNVQLLSFSSDETTTMN